MPVTNLLKVNLTVFTLILFIGNGYAQLAGTQLAQRVQYSKSSGEVSLTQDEELLTLIDKHLYEESKQNGIIGYRIRLYSNSGRQARKEGELREANFISRYPDVRTSFVFDTPFYILYAGDFRTHSEAMKFLKEIERYYPDAFIVRSTIRYPSL